MKNRIIPILVGLMLIAVLFPFGWLGQEWLPLGQVLYAVFPNAQRHAIGHSTMFFLLGLLLLAVLPGIRRRPLVYLGLILLAGIGQEFFQQLYKQSGIGFDEIRDLVTDLIGGMLAYIGYWLITRRAAHDPAVVSRR